MELNITGAALQNGTLMLQVDKPYLGAMLRFVRGFRAGKYSLSPAAKKRSLDANAYAWALIGKLAAAMAMDKNELYRDAIMAVGASDHLLMKQEAYDEFKRNWEAHGLGCICVKTDDWNNGWCEVNAYYGSSSYTTAQMSALIEYLVQDCESIGIETDNGRIASLLETWDKERSMT